MFVNEDSSDWTFFGEVCYNKDPSDGALKTTMKTHFLIALLLASPLFAEEPLPKVAETFEIGGHKAVVYAALNLTSWPLKNSTRTTPRS